jgi:hypothetical protein
LDAAKLRRWARINDRCAGAGRVVKIKDRHETASIEAVVSFRNSGGTDGALAKSLPDDEPI